MGSQIRTAEPNWDQLLHPLIALDKSVRISFLLIKLPFLFRYHGVNQYALTVQLRGDRPENQPKAEQTTDASEGAPNCWCSERTFLRLLICSTRLPLHAEGQSTRTATLQISRVKEVITDSNNPWTFAQRSSLVLVARV